MVLAKNYETVSTFVEVMQKKLWPLFFRTRCRKKKRWRSWAMTFFVRWLIKTVDMTCRLFWLCWFTRNKTDDDHNSRDLCLRACTEDSDVIRNEKLYSRAARTSLFNNVVRFVIGQISKTASIIYSYWSSSDLYDEAIINFKSFVFKQRQWCW